MRIELNSYVSNENIKAQFGTFSKVRNEVLYSVDTNNSKDAKLYCNLGNNDKIKVSIIIPSFNSQSYISKCLDSILGQNYSNLEIIVVDDASTDNTIEIIRKLAIQDKRINLISLPQNVGSALARQKGIDSCSGEMITFVDADDCYNSSEAIKIMVQAFEMTNADCIMYGYRVVHNHGLVLKKRFNSRGKMYSVQEATINKITHPSPYWHYLWNKCYKGSVIRENSITFCEELRRAQDVRFNADFMRYAKNFYILPNNYLYDYNCTNLNQITRKSNIGTLQSELRSFENLKEELHRLSNDFEFIGVYNQCIIPLYKQFYANTIQLLKSNNFSLMYEELKKWIYDDEDYEKSITVLGNYIIVLNVKAYLHSYKMRLKTIVKRMINV